MVDPLMNVWDAAAIQPIVTEAGGTFTDWQGRPTIYGGEGIATNGLVLDEVLAITRGAVDHFFSSALVTTWSRSLSPWS